MLPWTQADHDRLCEKVRRELRRRELVDELRRGIRRARRLEAARRLRLNRWTSSLPIRERSRRLMAWHEASFAAMALREVFPVLVGACRIEDLERKWDPKRICGHAREG